MFRLKQVLPPGAFLLSLQLSIMVAAADAPLPDPTKPPLAHQAAIARLADDNPSQFSVTAIKISESSRKAIVNGVLVAEGDKINSATVLEIVPGAVVLDYLSQKNRISLLPAAGSRVVPRPATSE